MKYLPYSFILTGSLGALLLSSCDKKMETYNAGPGINFYAVKKTDTSKVISFFYYSDSKVLDTVWLELETIGQLSDEDRPVQLKQSLTGTDDAQPGVHYIPFDDNTLKSQYIIPAGESRASIPVVLKRDASLKTKDYTLKLELSTNEYFTLLKPTRNKAVIVISDQINKPANWNFYADHFWGAYGKAKHKFMIDSSGKKWDYDYLYNEVGLTESSPYQNDLYEEEYMIYLNGFFREKLTAYNDKRVADGLEVLKEADGTPVSFPIN